MAPLIFALFLLIQCTQHNLVLLCPQTFPEMARSKYRDTLLEIPALATIASSDPKYLKRAPLPYHAFWGCHRIALAYVQQHLLEVFPALCNSDKVQRFHLSAAFKGIWTRWLLAITIMMTLLNPPSLQFTTLYGCKSTLAPGWLQPYDQAFLEFHPSLRHCSTMLQPVLTLQKGSLRTRAA